MHVRKRMMGPPSHSSTFMPAANNKNNFKGRGEEEKGGGKEKNTPV